MIAADIRSLEVAFAAPCQQPLPVVLKRGDGAYVYDVNGNAYIDMASAVAVLNFGHSHPKLLAALMQQASELTASSRLFFHEHLGTFLAKACKLTKQDQAIAMNTGVEAVETAIKVVRKWGYQKKGIPENSAQIISCHGNFHGRTIATISMSSHHQYQHQFGPLIPGMTVIPYNDVNALKAAITDQTVAFFVEAIQGEGGVQIPDSGYLKACETICREANVLLICDEIQTGMGRTGQYFAYEHDAVDPDGVLLGKALGGGILPVSLFLAKHSVMSVLKPGDHGSTFGGNPLASRVACAALDLLVDEQLAVEAATKGAYFLKQLQSIQSPLIKNIRGRGFMIGMEFHTHLITSKTVCLQFLENGLLSIDTRGNVLRLLPPLIIGRESLDQAVHIIEKSLYHLEKEKCVSECSS